MRSTSATRGPRPERPPGSGPLHRSLMVAFVAVVVAFLSATALTQRRADDIRATAERMSGIAAPSIEHLASARAQLRHLQVFAFQLRDAAPVGAGGKRAPGEALKERMHQELEKIHEELSGYHALATFPGEQAYWPALDQAMRGVDGAMASFLAAIDARQPREAELQLEEGLVPACERASDIIFQIVEFHGRNMNTLASHIRDTHVGAERIGWGLDAVAAFLALGVAVALRRALRRSEEIARAHAKLLEVRAEELEQFAGRVAHDILSPLTVVGLAIEAGRRGAINQSVVQNLGRGSASLQRVRRIVDGLLEFARAGALPEPGASASSAEVLLDVISEKRIAADAAQITLVLDAPTEHRVACSPGVLTSLVSNLLANAIKYMGEQKERRITLRVGNRPAGPWRLEVEDTGPGLAPEAIPSLFSPYVRGPGSSQPGIGLGLAMVKRMAEAHGGRCGAFSHPGRGSTFWIELPQLAEPLRELRGAPAAELSPPH